MYRAFKLGVSEDALEEDIIAEGRKILKRNTKEASESLLEYLGEDGALDASAIEEDWFGPQETDVFISHSHADEDKALWLAAVLENDFGLKAFVDSSVWGNCYDLLQMIDNEYSWLKKDEGIYSYEKTSRSAAHVHMLLATALSKVIDQSEAVFFLETSRSLTSAQAVKSTTNSPWIYHELEVIRRIQIKSPSTHRGHEKVAKEERAALRMLQIQYPVNFDRFTKLTDTVYQNWRKVRKRNEDEHSLDLLYKLLPLKHPIKELLVESNE